MGQEQERIETVQFYSDINMYSLLYTISVNINYNIHIHINKDVSCGLYYLCRGDLFHTQQSLSQREGQ